MTQRFVQTAPVALASSIGISDTSITIIPHPKDLNGNNLVMADFGTTPTLTIDPKISEIEEICSFTGITDNGNNTATLTGVTRNLSSIYPYTTLGTGRQHGSNAIIVFSDNPQMFNRLASKENDEDITGQWTFDVFPITPATPNASDTVKGMTKLSTAPVAPTIPIAVGDNDPRVPSADPTTLFAPISVIIPSAVINPFGGRVVPTGWLLCDGSAVSRTTYAALFAALVPTGVFTVTIASPGVFTKIAHTLVEGDIVHFTTTGALPTGLAVNTDYYVISAGITADAFQVAATRGGVAINTTGSQSGVHTFFAANDGKGDGSTTFNLPNIKGKSIYGYDASDDNFDAINTPNTYVGAKTHVLTIAEMPAHDHPGSTADMANGVGGGTSIANSANQVTVAALIDVASQGSGTAHNNMPPYTVRKYIIKI